MSSSSRLPWYQQWIKIFQCKHFTWIKRFQRWVHETITRIQIRLARWKLKRKYGYDPESFDIIIRELGIPQNYAVEFYGGYEILDEDPEFWNQFWYEEKQEYRIDRRTLDELMEDDRLKVGIWAYKKGKLKLARLVKA